MLNDSAAEHASYQRHDELADYLGKPRHCGGYNFSPIEVALDDGRSVMLTGTANAGFLGIVGYFTQRYGRDEIRFQTSLGHVASWEV